MSEPRAVAINNLRFWCNALQAVAVLAGVAAAVVPLLTWGLPGGILSLVLAPVAAVPLLFAAACGKLLGRWAEATMAPTAEQRPRRSA